MQFSNVNETTQRKCNENPAARNLQKLEQAKKDVSISVELDKISSLVPTLKTHSKFSAS